MSENVNMKFVRANAFFVAGALLGSPQVLNTCKAQMVAVEKINFDLQDNAKPKPKAKGVNLRGFVDINVLETKPATTAAATEANNNDLHYSALSERKVRISSSIVIVIVIGLNSTRQRSNSFVLVLVLVLVLTITH